MTERDETGTVARTMRVQQGGNWRFQVELPGLRLRVRSGPDSGLQESFCLPLIRIGGGSDNDLVLTDPTVSRRHAELRVGEDGVSLRDLESTNGTFVGSARVKEVTLAPGSEFRVGDSTLLLEAHTDRRNSLIGERDRLGALIGGSPPMRELYALLKAVGPTQATVLVQGETGTGKELVARTLHELSGLPGPLVPFDCATTDPASVRSDLFGHEKGAFTGAQGARKGAFREAAGGTLFLDEVGELPLDMQPRLLRALEAREVVPMGADRPVPVKVRVVAATHRDLATMVEAGSFREDLFHRLAIIQVGTPPLRDRTGDLPGLVDHLLEGVSPGASVSDAARAKLEAHSWPGNVRELRNVLEQAAALAGGAVLGPEHVKFGRVPGSAPAPAPVLDAGPSAPAAPATGTLQESERAQILAALERCFWNQTAAAKELGISRSTLKRRIKEYKLKG